MNEKITSASEWLQSKFEGWRYQKGVRKTLTEFAAYIGITEERLLAFLDGSELPKGANLAKLGGTLGFEIYELMGIKTSLILDTLPPLFRVRFASAFTEYYETITAQSLEIDSPEAQATLNEMMKKYQLTEVFSK
ncbi:MAG: hypothetical protein LLG42_02790 [Chloroflexi bacterium]|nr:hypothetical protein [Chloroflexota bacterium]